MKTKRTLILAIGAALAALTAPATRAADATDRSSMPDFCTQRDVNCVLPDGTRAGGAAYAAPSASGQSTQPQNVVTPAGAASAGAGSNTAIVIPAIDASGVTTVVTPPVGSPAGSTTAGPTVPSVPALPGQVPSLPGAVPSLPGQVPSLSGQVPSLTTGDSTTGTTSSTTSGGTTGTTASGTSTTTGASGARGARRVHDFWRDHFRLRGRHASGNMSRGPQGPAAADFRVGARNSEGYPALPVC